MPRPVPDLDTLMRYVAAGHVSRVDLGPLSIFNYTERCTWDAAWDEVTTVTRGLIIDRETGEIAARGFDKFFNYGERGVPVHLPEGPPDVVTIKHDGSLGIAFRHEGRLRWSTRGSFYSPHAAAANRIWAARYADRVIPDHLTLLAEIIAPETRVIVPYDFEDLVLIGLRDRHTGEDLPWDAVAAFAAEHGLPVTEVVDGDLHALVARAAGMTSREEGFVLRWGDARLKVKSRQYMHVARLLTGLSDRTLGDLWYARKLAVLADLPDEPRQSSEATIAGFEVEAEAVRVEVDRLAAEVAPLERRARVAALGVQHPLFGLVMARVDGKPLDVRLYVYVTRFGGNRPREA